MSSSRQGTRTGARFAVPALAQQAQEADKQAPQRPAPTRKTPPTTTGRGPGAEDRGVAALEGQHPTGGRGAAPIEPEPGTRIVEAAYAEPPWHPRMKDPTAATSEALIDEISAVQHDWTAANRGRLAERNQPAPTNSGFREALLRLGLKHLNDPEFIELIPPDARRRRR